MYKFDWTNIHANQETTHDIAAEILAYEAVFEFCINLRVKSFTSLSCHRIQFGLSVVLFLISSLSRGSSKSCRKQT